MHMRLKRIGKHIDNYVYHYLTVSILLFIVSASVLICTKYFCDLPSFIRFLSASMLFASLLSITTFDINLQHRAPGMKKEWFAMCVRLSVPLSIFTLLFYVL
jgi:hypothetical protein